MMKKEKFYFGIDTLWILIISVINICHMANGHLFHATRYIYSLVLPNLKPGLYNYGAFFLFFIS